MLSLLVVVVFVIIIVNIIIIIIKAEWRAEGQILMCVQPLLKGGHSFLFPSLIFSGVKMGMFVKDTYHDVGPDHGNGE